MAPVGQASVQLPQAEHTARSRSMPSSERVMPLSSQTSIHESQHDAAVLVPLHFRAHVQALRVVAPGAAQRAALEEHGGADARPVLGGEALQVQNGADDVLRRNSVILNCRYHI